MVPEASGGNEYKCELPIVQLSFLFSLEPPLPCSYQSGTSLPFILETNVKGRCWNYDQISIHMQSTEIYDRNQSYFLTTDGYCFTKATVFLDVFI